MLQFEIPAKTLVVGASSLALIGCGGHHDDTGYMTGPSYGMMGPGPNGTYPNGTDATGLPALVSVDPAGGATGVPVSTSIILRFGTPMGWGMERFVDLHVGDTSGPVTPMTCGWSADSITLTCAPTSPLQPRTLYTIHLGGGMVDWNGRYVDMEQYGIGMGGWWVMGSMMGAYHAGGPWAHMGYGWMSPSNGAYGMGVSFTTA